MKGELDPIKNENDEAKSTYLKLFEVKGKGNTFDFEKVKKIVDPALTISTFPWFPFKLYP